MRASRLFSTVHSIASVVRVFGLNQIFEAEFHAMSSSGGPESATQTGLRHAGRGDELSSEPVLLALASSKSYFPGLHTMVAGTLLTLASTRPSIAHPACLSGRDQERLQRRRS